MLTFSVAWKMLLSIIGLVFFSSAMMRLVSIRLCPVRDESEDSGVTAQVVQVSVK